jgi:hypothetical protein
VPDHVTDLAAKTHLLFLAMATVTTIAAVDVVMVCTIIICVGIMGPATDALALVTRYNSNNVANSMNNARSQILGGASNGRLSRL